MEVAMREGVAADGNEGKSQDLGAWFLAIEEYDDGF